MLGKRQQFRKRLTGCVVVKNGQAHLFVVRLLFANLFDTSDWPRELGREHAFGQPSPAAPVVA